MAIYDPRVFLSEDDRELLRLLGELLIVAETDVRTTNYCPKSVALSDAEACALLRLLESFVTSKKFVEGTYFLEKLFSGSDLYGADLRDIYLRWRKRLGGSRAVAAIQWENLLGRLGLWTSARGNPNVWYRANASPMDFAHFLRMEERLATAAKLHPRVKALIISFVAARQAAIDAVRFGDRKLAPGQIAKPPKNLLQELKAASGSPIGIPPVKSTKIAAVMVIVLDFSAIFTTRDWSVAGFMSTIGGALPPAAMD